jgi:hypothetical protein
MSSFIRRAVGGWAAVDEVRAVVAVRMKIWRSAGGARSLPAVKMKAWEEERGLIVIIV